MRRAGRVNKKAVAAGAGCPTVDTRLRAGLTVHGTDDRFPQKVQVCPELAASQQGCLSPYRQHLIVFDFA
jgi:hypothetical protein